MFKALRLVYHSTQNLGDKRRIFMRSDCSLMTRNLCGRGQAAAGRGRLLLDTSEQQRWSALRRDDFSSIEFKIYVSGLWQIGFGI